MIIISNKYKKCNFTIDLKSSSTLVLKMIDLSNILTMIIQVVKGGFIFDTYNNIVFMNYLAQMLRDCSKNKPSTFSDISFPIMQEIESKIRNKNQVLRRRYKMKLAERQKMKTEQYKQESWSHGKGNRVFYNKVDREQINYIEAFEEPKVENDSIHNLVYLPKGRLDEKDEETTYQIYLLLRKRKSIFKVQEVKRKLKYNHGRRASSNARYRLANLQKIIEKEEYKQIKMEDVEQVPQIEVTQSVQQNQQIEEAVKVQSELFEDKNIGQQQKSLKVEQIEKKEIIVQLAQIDVVKEEEQDQQNARQQLENKAQTIEKKQNPEFEGILLEQKIEQNISDCHPRLPSVKASSYAQINQNIQQQILKQEFEPA